MMVRYYSTGAAHYWAFETKEGRYLVRLVQNDDATIETIKDDGIWRSVVSISQGYQLKDGTDCIRGIWEHRGMYE